ncbi:hypothetical protein [Brevibacillus sp. 179-C9.3 HS]|uniref:hypothetical protein n=1 Tax=unclassified Brevibacillus TaxID=2684853 RepID=UPI0039A0953C
MTQLRQRDKEHYTWNSQWVDQYESPWSIIEKFRYANNITWKEVKILLSGENVTKKGKRLPFIEYSSWYHVNDTVFEYIFGFSLLGHYKKLIQNMSFVFTGEHEIAHLYLRESFSCCKICISYGYHSLFHQFVLLDTCPFHLCNLIHHCPSCNKKLNFQRLSFSVTPFLCRCGYSFIKHTSHTGFPWNKRITHKIALPEFKLWTEQRKDSKILNTLLFYEKNFLKNNNQVLKNLLSVFEERKHLDQSCQVRSHPLYLSERFNKKEISVNDLYFETRLLFKSIARHYRKTILFKHKKCIRKFVKLYPDETICPFAYAYVHWRKSIEGITNYWQVDNSVRCTKPTMFDHFYSKPDNNLLLTLLIRWKKTMPLYSTDIVMKWGVNHVAAQLFTHHFKVWLKIAKEYAPQKSILHTREHTYEGLPLFTICFCEIGKKQVEFHLWKSVHDERRETLTQLICPFK